MKNSIDFYQLRFSWIDTSDENESIIFQTVATINSIHLNNKTNFDESISSIETNQLFWLTIEINSSVK